MPGMKIKVPSKSVHMKQQAGAGSAPPKQYVKAKKKNLQRTPTPLGIEDEEEVTYQSAPITQQPAMQQTQKEVQVKPQKEMQVKPQKNSQFKRKPVENRLLFKTTCDRKQNRRKRKHEVFGKCITAPQPPIKPKRI